MRRQFSLQSSPAAIFSRSDIDQAFVKVGIGAEKKSKVISEKEKKITAYHETGHAILFHELPDVGPVHTISIIPTGMGAAGYTMPLPEKDEMFNTKSKMLETIMVSLGGRIAEEIIFGRCDHRRVPGYQTGIRDRPGDGDPVRYV